MFSDESHKQLEQWQQMMVFKGMCVCVYQSDQLEKNHQIYLLYHVNIRCDRTLFFSFLFFIQKNTLVYTTQQYNDVLSQKLENNATNIIGLMSKHEVLNSPPPPSKKNNKADSALPTHSFNRQGEKKRVLRTYLPQQEWLWWECVQWSRLGWVLFPTLTKQMGPPPDNPTFSHPTFHLEGPTLLPESSPPQNFVLTLSKTHKALISNLQQIHPRCRSYVWFAFKNSCLFICIVFSYGHEQFSNIYSFCSMFCISLSLSSRYLVQ